MIINQSSINHQSINQSINQINQSINQSISGSNQCNQIWQLLLIPGKDTKWKSKNITGFCTSNRHRRTGHPEIWYNFLVSVESGQDVPVIYVTCGLGSGIVTRFPDVVNLLVWKSAGKPWPLSSSQPRTNPESDLNWNGNHDCKSCHGNIWFAKTIRSALVNNLDTAMGYDATQHTIGSMHPHQKSDAINNRRFDTCQ